MVEIPGHDSEGSSGTARVAMCDSQKATAGPGFTYYWTQISMDQVVSATNMQHAFHRVAVPVKLLGRLSLISLVEERQRLACSL